MEEDLEVEIAAVELLLLFFSAVSTFTYASMIASVFEAGTNADVTTFEVTGSLVATVASAELDDLSTLTSIAGDEADDELNSSSVVGLVTGGSVSIGLSVIVDNSSGVVLDTTTSSGFVVDDASGNELVTLLVETSADVFEGSSTRRVEATCSFVLASVELSVESD